MGIEDNYRTSKIRQEIIDSLINIHEKSSPILIWQIEEKKRTIAHAKIESVDSSNNSIILSPFSIEDENTFKIFKLNTTIYMRGDNKNIVFKQEQSSSKTDSGFLQIFIPSEVKMFEKRSEARLTFTELNPNYTTHISPTARRSLTAKITIAVLRDLTTVGMGILLNKKFSKLFFEKDNIKIEKIGTYRFPRPILGKIVYIDSEINTSNQFRIGISFNETISSDIYIKIQTSLLSKTSKNVK